MSKILDLFHDPVWWFSAIVVGILLNLFSAYIKERIDGFAGQLSVSARKKKEKREAEMNRMAVALKGKIEERIHLQFLHAKAVRSSGHGTIACMVFGTLVAINVLMENWWIAAGFLAFVVLVAWSDYREDRKIEFIEQVLMRSINDSPYWNSYKEPPSTPEPPAST